MLLNIMCFSSKRWRKVLMGVSIKCFTNYFQEKSMKIFPSNLLKNVIRKISTISHGKGVVDGIGGNVKSIVRLHVMSMKKQRPIRQGSERFTELVKKLVPSTKIKHFFDEEIANCKRTNPFRNSVFLNGNLICMF